MGNDPELEQPPNGPETVDDDTEAHSVALIMGLDALSRSRQKECPRSKCRGRSRSR
jgi:hypothetical protein